MNSWHFKMLYNGGCPICQAEVKRLSRWNRKGWLVFEDITANDFDPEKYSRTMDQLMAEIHGVYPDGRVISGMQVFRESYTAIGKGWLLAPTQWPIFQTIFDLLYAQFARHRVKLGQLLGRWVPKR
jgi:predicted DCC family thiol-disulfide oxidoreductase YuxK